MFKNISAWASWVKKSLAAASAAFVVTGEVFSDGIVEGGWLPLTGEKLTLITAWAAVFGVFWLTNGKDPRKK